jgi:hypothetical protein
MPQCREGIGAFLFFDYLVFEPICGIALGFESMGAGLVPAAAPGLLAGAVVGADDIADDDEEAASSGLLHPTTAIATITIEAIPSFLMILMSTRGTSSYL